MCRLQVPDAPVAPTGRATGLDVGLTTFATTEHPATDIPNPRFARAAAKALIRSQRDLARKQKGSKGRAAARQRKARIEAHTANQRTDWQHKAARDLVGVYDRIGVEKLQVKNMSRSGTGRRQDRAEPLHRRRRLGPVPGGSDLAGHQGRQDGGPCPGPG